jgi:hypothetical protein
MREEELPPPSYSEINNSNISIIPIPYYTSNSGSSNHNAQQLDDQISTIIFCF